MHLYQGLQCGGSSPPGTPNSKNPIKMSTKKHFHRENCQNLIRMAFTDPIGRVIILSGIHAFEWTVTVFSGSAMTTITFSNRAEATKEFNRYRRKR